MDQAQLNAQHRQAIARYLDPPKGSDARWNVEIELASIERALKQPPDYRNEKGVWVARSTGLKTAEQVRAAATKDGLERLADLADARTKVETAPRIRDAFDVIAEADIPDAIAEQKREQAENIHRIKFQLDQDGIGSCAAEGGTGDLMTIRDKAGLPFVLLNPLFPYHTTSGGVDGGSSLSDTVAFLIKYGCASEAVWPRSKGFRTEPSSEAWEDAKSYRLDEVFQVSNRLEFITALIRGFPVYCGYPGHAWFAFDAIDANRFWWKNSWGSDWGTDGASTLRFDEVATYYGMYAFRTPILAG